MHPIRVQLWALYRRFSDNHFPGQTFPGQVVSRTIQFPDKTFPGQELSRTITFPDKTFPVEDVSRTFTFPDRRFPDKLLRNFNVHSVCKYQLYRPSHTICRYTEHLLMCACRPVVSIQGLFGKALVQQWVKRA